MFHIRVIHIYVWMYMWVCVYNIIMHHGQVDLAQEYKEGLKLKTLLTWFSTLNIKSHKIFDYLNRCRKIIWWNLLPFIIKSLRKIVIVVNFFYLIKRSHRNSTVSSILNDEGFPLKSGSGAETLLIIVLEVPASCSQTRKKGIKIEKTKQHFQYLCYVYIFVIKTQENLGDSKKLLLDQIREFDEDSVYKD